jgi:membrane-associated PAP2 superfamily phosphatase
MAPPLKWYIFHIIVDCLGLIVFVYVLSRFKGDWLLNDTLNSTISMTLKV